MPNRPTRRTALLLGLTAVAVPATARAAIALTPYRTVGLDDPVKRRSR